MDSETNERVVIAFYKEMKELLLFIFVEMDKLNLKRVGGTVHKMQGMLSKLKKFFNVFWEDMQSYQ